MFRAFAASLLFVFCLLGIQVVPSTCYCVSGLTASKCNDANGAWVYTGKLIKAVAEQTATLLPNGEVLVAGGAQNSTASTNVTQLYDPTNGQWYQTGNLNAARSSHTATFLKDNMVLVAGGGIYLYSTELYNPSTGVWTYTGNLSYAREGHTATLLSNGAVLILGGYGVPPGSNNANAMTSIELYDPNIRSWSTYGNLNVARVLHTSTLLPSGLVLVVGGENGYGYSISTVELYDPNIRLVVNSTVNQNTARFSHTATLLLNGQVLVVGGQYDLYVELSSCALYNPTSNTWSTTGSLNAPFTAHTATLLPNGLVLVAGAGAELYTPSTGTWSIAASLNTPRYDHTASFLPNGLVLVAGGVAASSSPALASAELWSPSISVTTYSGSQDTSLGGLSVSLEGPTPAVPTPNCLFSNEGTTNRGYSILFTNTTSSISLCCSRIGLYASSSCIMNTCSGLTNMTNYFYTSDLCFSNCVDNSTTKQFLLFTVPAANTTMNSTFTVSSNRTAFILTSSDAALPAFLVQSSSSAFYGCRAKGNFISTNGIEGCQYTIDSCAKPLATDYYTYLRSQLTNECYALCYQ